MITLSIPRDLALTGGKYNTLVTNLSIEGAKPVGTDTHIVLSGGVAITRHVFLVDGDDRPSTFSLLADGVETTGYPSRLKLTPTARDANVPVGIPGREDADGSIRSRAERSAARGNYPDQIDESGNHWIASTYDLEPMPASILKIAHDASGVQAKTKEEYKSAFPDEVL